MCSTPVNSDMCIMRNISSQNEPSHWHFIIPSKKHSKVNINYSNCIFPARHKQAQAWTKLIFFSALWTCWKTWRTTFWVFQLLPQKKNNGGTWHVTMVQEVPFPAYSLALALWSDLASSNHPSCPHGDTIHLTLDRNARILEGPPHHFPNQREHFQALLTD